VQVNVLGEWAAVIVGEFEGIHALSLGRDRNLYAALTALCGVGAPTTGARRCGGELTLFIKPIYETPRRGGSANLAIYTLAFDFNGVRLTRFHVDQAKFRRADLVGLFEQRRVDFHIFEALVEELATGNLARFVVDDGQ